MEIAIVGAGIAGLTCAIALRRQGHVVTLYEQSRLNQETGAAIFLPPNVNGLLREFSFIPEDYGANYCLGWQAYSANGDLEIEEQYSVKQYPAPWQLIHRQKLHQALKKLAEDPHGPGKAAKVVTSSHVVSVDAENAVIHLDDGVSIQKDVVVGADGVSSKTRSAVQKKYGINTEPFSSGHNCFRFLIPQETLLADPATRPSFESPDTFRVWSAEDRKVVCYPCDGNTTMNFVAIHPISLSSNPDDAGWRSKGSKKELLSIFDGFCPELKAALAHSDPERIRLYPLMDLEPMPGWTNGRLALIGDAAHPFLPYLAQGGAQAIEDALAMGVFLAAGTKTSEVSERLKMFESSRIERAHAIQQATRIMGQNKSAVEKSGIDVHAEREYQFQYNVLEVSRAYLQAHSSVLAAQSDKDEQQQQSNAEVPTKAGWRSRLRALFCWPKRLEKNTTPPAGRT